MLQKVRKKNFFEEAKNGNVTIETITPKEIQSFHSSKTQKINKE